MRGQHGEENHEGRRERRGGAQTFRRKRAMQFLKHLETKQASLKKQLETPELQNLNSIALGELKATQEMMDVFIDVFELYEIEGSAPNDSKA